MPNGYLVSVDVIKDQACCVESVYVFHQMVASETKKDFKELFEPLSEKNG